MENTVDIIKMIDIIVFEIDAEDVTMKNVKDKQKIVSNKTTTLRINFQE